jgi:endonuclease/exonuclease/phosphatase (EEP) superfamily protein YafD
LTAGAIGTMPIIARHVDGSADEFTGRRFEVLPGIGWLVCAALMAVVVTRWLQRASAVTAGPALALAYDGLPIVLIAAWIVAIASGLTGHWLLLAVTGLLCAYHLSLMVPRFATTRAPSWARHAPRVRVVVANVFVDYRSPEAAARQLAESGAEVIVIVESTPDFMRLFDEHGGRTAYPHRVDDPDDISDYAVTIASSHPLGPRSEICTRGCLRVAVAEVDVRGTSTLIVGLNAMATVDPGGLVTWREQMDVLADLVRSLDGPLIVVGDLNATRYRPEMEQIYALGLHDAIDALGKGMSPSFKIAASGPLAVAPVVRLDHALHDDEVCGLRMRNLDACGSDHLPFEIEFAIRPRRPDGGQRRRTSAQAA